MEFAMRKTVFPGAAAMFAGLLALGGCQIPPDTGATDPDRFVEETTPVWSRPAVTRSLPLTGAIMEFPNSRPLEQISYGAYDPIDDGGHWLPAIPLGKVSGRLLRQKVEYPTSERPGTIVVDAKAHFLYLVEDGGTAMRYGIGVGREGFSWKGRGQISQKREWPRWTPTEDMVNQQSANQPFSAKFGGLVGGINNPLGARALYISRNGVDTLYRVHGTPDWKSVGHDASSGCIRMFNQDVIDLYDRIEKGAPILVL